MAGGPKALACGDIVVRALTRRDEPAWLSLRERNRAWLRPWEATEPPGRVRTPVTFRALLRYERRQFRRRRGFNMVIVARGAVIGRICVTGIEWGAARSGSLGYWIDERFAGRGIVPLAGAMLTEYAFGEGLHRIEIAARPENESSLRVARKLGFRDEGIRKRYMYIDGGWRDHRVFALTSDEKRVGEAWDSLRGAVSGPRLD